MIAAPFYADLAEGPDGGRAIWLQAADGVRIRAGFWGGGPNGTILLVPGKGEYIEKYGRVAANLGAGGWSLVTLDLRGQGLSDRLLPDSMLGHVGCFADYQLDLEALCGWMSNEGGDTGIRGPLMMIAHSMGGLIGLRALYRAPEIRAVFFVSPMWGILLPTGAHYLAELLSRINHPVAGDNDYAPTQTSEDYLLGTDFKDNILTSDPEAWEFMRQQKMVEPRFQLGGPSLGWLRAALREARLMAREPAPDVRAKVALGSREAVVDPEAVRLRLKDWPRAVLDLYPDARHELMMEVPATRTRLIRDMLKFFDEAAGDDVRSEG